MVLLQGLLVPNGDHDFADCGKTKPEDGRSRVDTISNFKNQMKRLEGQLVHHPACVQRKSMWGIYSWWRKKMMRLGCPWLVAISKGSMRTSCLKGLCFRVIRGGGGGVAPCFGLSSDPHFLGHLAAYGAWTRWERHYKTSMTFRMD